MSKTFFIGDLHFSHENIMKYDGRPFDSTEEMDKSLIERWNNVVEKDDIVYLMGDVSMKCNDDTYNLVKQLKGHKILIEGNHGRLKPGNRMINLYEEVTPYKEINLDGIFIVLSHFPIMDWNGRHHGSIHLYAHVHNSPMSDIVESYRRNEMAHGRVCNMYNTFCGLYKYAPATLEQIIQRGDSQ